MTRAFERRVEQFQNKVQVKINLSDDEIARLTTDLCVLQGLSSGLRDKIQKLSQLNTQTYYMKDGAKATNKVIAQSKCAEITTGYQEMLRDLQQRQAEEIKNIQDDYQKSLVDIQKWAEKETGRRCGKLDAQINRIKQEIDHYKQKVILKDEDDHSGNTSNIIQEMEYNRLERLERAVRDKTDERLESLLEHKSRLSETIRALEEMDRMHALRVKTYQNALDQLEKKHRNIINRTNSKSAQDVAIYKHKLDDLKFKEQSLKNAMERIQSAQSHEINNILTLNKDLENTMKSIVVSQPRVDAEALSKSRKKFENTRRMLEEKDGELLKARSLNETMKREVARLKHEIKMKNKNR